MKDGKQIPGSHQDPVETFKGHPGMIITSIATFQDGRRIATSCDDNTMRIWRLEDGTELMKWEVREVGALVILRNGKHVLCAEEELEFDARELWVRDAESGRVIAGPVKDGHTDFVDTLDISPEGEILATVYCIQISPSTHQLAVAIHKDIETWDLDRRKCLVQFNGHRTRIITHNSLLTWTRDGSHLLSAGNDSVIRSWETSTWKQAGDPWIGHDSDDYMDISHITLNSAGTLLVSVSDDHSVRLWQLPAGTEVARFQHSHEVSRVTFSVDERFIFSGGLNKISQWEIPEQVLAAVRSDSLAGENNEAGPSHPCNMKGPLDLNQQDAAVVRQ
ncbi:WD40-repeat-containing domain protein [Suillus paluster]|uniref:WD40-repeat-containing domain protein n=1 Tax=Suillus paluster TaxID=48578 RepID=UPI001B8630E6|nr:WD40-repeat-containing domain protein [Suillus paluster]KAG1727184.1 WD40-repeat-containing domain protein [Suillus paluster]